MFPSGRPLASTAVLGGVLSHTSIASSTPSPPESTPVRTAGPATGALNKGGAFVAFFPNSNTRQYRVTFTSTVEYTLEYREAGGAWTPGGSGAISEDQVFPGAKCFILSHWWSGTFTEDHQFQFEADPLCSTIEVPVLFQNAGGKALAYTNNHVNCLVDGNFVLTAESHEPVVDYNQSGTASDILGDYAQAAFRRAGYASIDEADERWYHNAYGSIHCGTNVQRVVPTHKWWEH